MAMFSLRKWGRWVSTIGAGFILLTLVGYPLTSWARIKCWTNSEGVRECGNRVPPEYIQQGHQVLSTDGVVIDRKGRAKTDEEITEQERIANEKAEQERLAREQAALDQILLDTFSSEDDLLMARDGRLSALESRITLTEAHVDKLKSSLDDLIKLAADMERRGEPPSDNLLNNIQDVRRQISENILSIQAQREEQQAVRERFERDLGRFQALRGRSGRRIAQPGP